ncbi:MAG: ArsA family ATPase [Gammaproteobacteria bacterium]|nr:MAG: ArsA family ATPase [Gammaproteobacteria bacterium]
MLLKRLLARGRTASRTMAEDLGVRPDLTFFGGKGGVGKTTCAAAWALGRAKAGHPVLLVSTDPAHSLGDLLELPLGPRPKPVAVGLDAMELAPDVALAEYISNVKANLRELASPELRTIAERQADLAAGAPGALDAALFEAMVRCILDLGPGYNEVVFDTAPTGQTLQLLSLPEVMATWTDAMLARRREARAEWMERAPEGRSAEDRAVAILDARRRRFEQVRSLLADSDHTGFIPVLNADALSFVETRRMVDKLTRAGINIPCLIVNRVLPDSAQGDFVTALRTTQARYLRAIDSTFAHHPRLRVDHRAQEIRGIDALLELASRITAAAQ